MSAAMLATDQRVGGRILWTFEYDAERVANITDDLKRGLRDRCICLMHAKS
jgi:hypothetical protein